jgi:hypothetical protein
MTKPFAFQKLCRQFSQDIVLIASSREELLLIITQALTRQERVQLKKELDNLLGGEYSDEQLLAVWNASPAEVYFKSVHDLKSILALVRDNIG